MSKKIIPSFNLDKIKFSTDSATFDKAIKLYEGGKVISFKQGINSYSAQVQGGQLYKVFIESDNFEVGDCSCFMGQNNYVCKHMVAVALMAVLEGQKLQSDDKTNYDQVRISDEIRELSSDESDEFKSSITSNLKFIKPYNGPSRIWFAYQSSLSEGCRHLSALVSRMPVGMKSCEILVNLLIRLDRKLSIGGVDDSDGTVGTFIEQLADVLVRCAELKPECIKSFRKLADFDSSFGWEKRLVQLFDQLN